MKYGAVDLPKAYAVGMARNGGDGIFRGKKLLFVCNGTKKSQKAKQMSEYVFKNHGGEVIFKAALPKFSKSFNRKKQHIIVGSKDCAVSKGYLKKKYHVYNLSAIVASVLNQKLQLTAKHRLKK